MPMKIQTEEIAQISGIDSYSERFSEHNLTTNSDNMDHHNIVFPASGPRGAPSIWTDGIPIDEYTSIKSL